MTGRDTHGNFRLGLSRADRYAAGKALRQRVPRDGHADCPPAWQRSAIAILAERDRSLIPELLPVRYERMVRSPFGFLRGAADVMAHDLALLPQIGAFVQAGGDSHVNNFGVFVSPEGRILFDVNDFDETLPNVDFTVDLKRLVASIAVLARERGQSDKLARSIAQGAARSYRSFVHELSAMSPLAVWSERMDIERELERIEPAKLRTVFLTALRKVRKNLDADKNYPRRTADNRIEDRPPLIYHFDPRRGGPHDVDLAGALEDYKESLLPERRALVERYALQDVAFKVVGVGSVGTFCAIGLFLTEDKEPLFLQIKEARPSVLARITAPLEDPVARSHQIVDGQRAMQAASDVFLGWTRDKRTSLPLYVRQLKHRRLDDIFDDVFAEIGPSLEVAALDFLARLCARTLARAHARTGDPACLAGYMGKSDVFDDALASFAMSYADQTVYDHARLQAAIDPATGVPSR